jgi:membrane protease YdiL (CAAX protease family)
MESSHKGLPKIWQAVLLLIAAFILQIVLSAGIEILHLFISAVPKSSSPVALSVVNIITFAMALTFCFFVFRRETVKQFLCLHSFLLITLLPLTAAAIGLNIIGSEIDNVLRSFFPMPEFLADIMAGLSFAGIASLVAVGLVAPFTEEFLFRSVIFRGFSERYTVRKAVLVSALLFTVFHLNPYQFFSAFVTGVLLAHILLRTGSIWPCIWLHAAGNSIGVILGNFTNISIPGYTTIEDLGSGAAQFQPLWFDALGVVLAIAGIIMFTLMTEEHPPLGHTGSFEDIPDEDGGNIYEG